MILKAAGVALATREATLPAAVVTITVEPSQEPFSGADEQSGQRL